MDDAAAPAVLAPAAVTGDGTHHARPIRVGGVPEHFNIPWHLAIERGIFVKHGVEVEWVTQPLGTGQMLKSLRDGEVDVIVALTEGLVLDMAKGSGSGSASSDSTPAAPAPVVRLLGTYVQSPLTWAISTGASSPYTTVESLRGTTFGVSRLTSGSHLMAYCLAQERGWDPRTDISFKPEGSFEALRASVNSGATSAFMWETFMTRPYHLKGEVRRVGELTTPWPCFMVASTDACVDAHAVALQRMMAGIREAVGLFMTERDASIARVVSSHGLSPEDAAQWFDGVHLSGATTVSEAALERALAAMRSVGALPSDCSPPLASLIDGRLASLVHDLQSVKLYQHGDLLRLTMCELQAAGLSGDCSLSFEQLLPFDQHHYGGTVAVDAAVLAVGTAAGDKVLNIGSGLGGPSRYMAGRYGLQVTAVEVQSELHRAAEELTQRCHLEAAVSHVCADILGTGLSLESASFRSVMSWLTVLHIGDRAALLTECHRVLQPGAGVFFAADFYDKGLEEGERKTLADDVDCHYLPTLARYIEDLTAAGFVDVRTQDMTAAWTDLTRTRAAAFGASQDRLTRITHGEEEVFHRLKVFYTKISDLFAGGRLGGVAITARKP